MPSGSRLTSLSPTAAARRRAIVFAVLLGGRRDPDDGVRVQPRPSRELQHGIGFAFRPIQGAVNDVGRGVALGRRPRSAEIDRLRDDNEALRAENERLEARERAGSRRPAARTSS